MSAPVFQQEDHLPIKKTLVVFGITLGTIVVSLGLDALFLHLATGKLRQTPAAAHGITSPAPREIAGVEQTPVRTDHAGLHLVAKQRETLRRYQWVDRERGIIRIPIERAMELVISEAQK